MNHRYRTVYIVECVHHAIDGKLLRNSVGEPFFANREREYLIQIAPLSEHVWQIDVSAAD